MKVRSNSRASVSGIGAPAQSQNRIDDRSRFASGAASSAIRTNGVAVAVAVVRYFSMRRRPSFGSQTSSRCVSAPTASGTSTPTTSPVACATGDGMNMTSSAVSWKTLWARPRPEKSRVFQVCTQPFAVDSVPEV